MAGGHPADIFIHSNRQYIVKSDEVPSAKCFALISELSFYSKEEGF